MGEGTQQAASSAGNALTEGTCVSYFPVAVIQQTRNKQPLKARRSCLGSPFTGFQLAVAKKARLLGWLAVVGGACSWFVGGGNQEAESAVQNQSQISPSGLTSVTHHHPGHSPKGRTDSRSSTTSWGTSAQIQL